MWVVQKLMGENLKDVLAEFSTLSEAAFVKELGIDKHNHI